MTSRDAPRRRENVFTLAKRLVSGGVTLAKLEVRRGRQEMAQSLVHLRGGVIKLALAAAFGLLFLIGLIAFIIAVLVAVGLWWVAFIFVLALLALAGVLAWRGIAQVTSTKFTPEETMASFKEDIEWAKTRLLRRG